MLRKKDFDRILMTMLRSNSGTSDLNFTSGKPLQVEASGKLTPVEFSPQVGRLTPFQTEMLAIAVMGGDRGASEALVKQGSADLAYAVPGGARFRVNVFQQRKQYSMVLRKLETKIMTLEDLGLPAIFKDMAAEKNGLILVTGATGSGKSTTLAALLNEMNETRSIHILTIEDPIEYVHPHKMATFNQRELGTDFDTFGSSLRAALRQAPKVILIGEMRDRDTVEIGLAAASTGHLVLSTLHSIDAGQTINRIVGMFDKDEEIQIRAKLAECLRFIVNQRLLPKEGGGRIASQEIMGMNLRVRELVVNGEQEGKSFYEIIGVSRNRGWQTHDQVLTDHYEAGKISEETALAYASNKPVLMREIDRLKQSKGIRDENELVLNVDRSVKEIAELMKKAWPTNGTYFPIKVDLPPESELIIYEPQLEKSAGRDVTFRFPIKIQGTITGVPKVNPRGVMMVTATSRGGDGALLKYQGAKIESIHIEDKDFTPKLKLVISTKFPEEILLPNQKFIPLKQKAVARIAEIGKFQHIMQLKNLIEKASDKDEISALQDAVKTIQERGA